MNEVEITLTYREWKDVAERLRRRDPHCAVAHMLTEWAEIPTSGAPQPEDHEPIRLRLSRASALRVLQARDIVRLVHVT